MARKRQVKQVRRRTRVRPVRRTRASKPRLRIPPPASAAGRAAPADSGLAPGMQADNSYLTVANVAASVEFLEGAFGFTRGVVLADADGQPRYAEMWHRDSVVMLIRKGDATAPTGGMAALYTYVDDVDRALARARQAGAGVEEAEDKPWGDRVATVTDPDGYKWVLATFKKLAPFT